MRRLTVGDLREALKDVPDDLVVKLSSDSGVDQGLGEVIIERAYRTTYTLGGGMTVDYFTIYANDYEEDEEDEEEELE